MTDIKRRSFLRGMAGIGALSVTGAADSSAAGVCADRVPRRLLGRTGEEVSIVGFGGAVMGHAYIGEEQALPLIHETIDLGINYIDTARIYDASEEYLGKVLPARRDEVFVVEKVRAETYAKAEESLDTSLKNLKLDAVDLLHIHNAGAFGDVDTVMGPKGSMEFVLEMQKKGKTRFTGVTGHTGGKKIERLAGTGKLDVLMVNLNFVDKHTYNFHEVILPTARKHNMGIVAMKVFGGRRPPEGGNRWAGYKTQGPASMPDQHLHDAFRYALSIEGVASAVIGVYTMDEVRQLAAWAKAFKPLTPSETERIDAVGQAISAKWQYHFGPV